MTFTTEPSSASTRPRGQSAPRRHRGRGTSRSGRPAASRGVYYQQGCAGCAAGWMGLIGPSRVDRRRAGRGGSQSPCDGPPRRLSRDSAHLHSWTTMLTVLHVDSPACLSTWPGFRPLVLHPARQMEQPNACAPNARRSSRANERAETGTMCSCQPTPAPVSGGRRASECTALALATMCAESCCSSRTCQRPEALGLARRLARHSLQHARRWRLAICCGTGSTLGPSVPPPAIGFVGVPCSSLRHCRGSTVHFLQRMRRSARPCRSATAARCGHRRVTPVTRSPRCVSPTARGE
jgi:hypothetical protein